MHDMQIVKRTGEVVDFDADKIRNAIMKAFQGNNQEIRDDVLNEIVYGVVQEVRERFTSMMPNVENVQDIAEKRLMEAGFFDIAKAYIIYRKEHAELREQKKIEAQRKLEERKLIVIKASGEREPFDEKKLRRTLLHAISGYEHLIDVEMVLQHCKEALYDEISTKEIARALLMTVRSLIENSMRYSYVAARLLFIQLYKEVIGPDADFKKLDKQYREAFVRNVKKAVDMGLLAEEILQFDLGMLAESLHPERDNFLAYLGAQTLHDRYFIRNVQTKLTLETPQAFWMRVAMGLAIKEDNKNARALEFYDVLSNLHYTPSTPTLFHAGTRHPQLSSCYLTTIEDDLHHIFKCIGDNAQLAKWSGGIGNDWSSLRGTGAVVKGNNITSNGIIPFMKIADDTTAAINRSGKRRGATCAYLETWHYDIEDFLELRKNTGDERRRTPDMNTANWIPDLFMKRVQDDGEWTLFSPNETLDLHHLYGKAFEDRYKHYESLAREGKMHLFKTMKARELWRKMLTMLFETGHPWITFKDPCNIRSPQDHTGVVHCSNLCTEITLNTSKDETAVCNLGSVNLARHIIHGKLDKALLEKTVTTAMRMLDNVVDINYYPTIEAKNSNLRHRPVGLGVMAFQDALYMLGIKFDSQECVEFADESMELISYCSILASSKLAQERGTYESYKGSKWDRGIFPQDTLDLLEKERGVPIPVSRGGKIDWTPVREHVKEYGMRNSNCLALAPTATIANIIGVFPTIEPIYKNIYVKSNQSGDFTVVNKYLIDELKRMHLWDHEMLGKLKYFDGNISKIPEIPQDVKDMYKEAFDIDPVWMIKAAAHRGKWIDQSQSLNIFYRGVSGREIANLYMYAWTLGLKTTYYLRTLAVSQVEKSTVSTVQYGVTHKRAELAPAVAAPAVVQAGNAALEIVPAPRSEAGESQVCESCQ
ncbi:MAG TPA: ribonucleoside-diphosphate reductase subunit alpha [Candidatus Nanoarchaeia archaeon]|nr:ribonucleoside-diphosphate reductase subunit alpha [Candidatus Nanoarchaeia archaeon]